MKQRATHLVRKPAELRALASPQRQELLVAVEVLQPCSVRQIAGWLGRLPVSLYYHLRKLERAGLLVRIPGGAGEARYRLPARRLRVAPERRGRDEVAALRRAGAGILRRAQRLHDLVVAEEGGENLLAQRTVRMSSAGFRRFRRELTALFDSMDDQRAEQGGFYTLTVHLARNPAHSAPGKKSAGRTRRGPGRR